MRIGDRIKARRKELGMTQTQLAEKLGLTSKAAVSTVENNKENMTTERIDKYAAALDTTARFLLGYTDDPEEKNIRAVNVQPIIDAFEREIADIINAPVFSEKIDEYAAKIMELSEEDQKSVFQYIDFLLSKGGQTS